MTKLDNSTRILGTLFALVFALGFTAGGIAGVLPIYKQLSGWWKAGSFVQVPARVVSTELESRSGHRSGRTYRVQAEFSYEYQGNSYLSRRIRLDDGGYDNVGGYHEAIHEQLIKARDSLSPVTLWVNPQQPGEAVYDRSIRWMLVVFLIPFAVLFPAVGLGAWWGIWRIWRNNDVSRDSNASLFKGGHSVTSPNAPWVIQGDGGGLTGLWVACTFWNILSWPIAILFFSSAKAATWWVSPIVSIFPAIGLVLLFNVLKIMRAQRRIGKPILTLDGPGSPGSMPLQGRIRFNPAFGAGMVSAEMTHDVKVTVEHVRDNRRGEDGSSTTLWQGQAMQAKIVLGTQSLNFKFDLPADLQASKASSWGQQYFQIVLEALGGTVKFRLPEDAVQAAAFPGQQIFRPQFADGLPVNASKVAVRVHWLAKAFSFAFAAFFLWTAVTQFAIPYYQSTRQKPQTDTQSSPANQQPQLAAGTEQLLGQAQQAVREGRFADLQQLLQAGVDANALDAEGQTMLMRAADRGDLKSVELLLAHGAQVNAKTAVDQEGRGAHTALHDAIRQDAVDVADALVRAGADTHAKANQLWTPMHYAAYLGAVKSIRYLHRHGVGIDEPFSGARGSTPLMLASQYGQVQAIRVLLELGADPMRKDVYNEDACGYARYFKASASFEALGCR